MVRKALTDQLVGRFIDDIVSGKSPPGSLLPSEIELAEREQVSRLTVREAIAVLKTKRVLDVKHGRGTLVNPIALWSPFDPALLAARSGNSVGAGVLPRKLIETRRLVEVGVAELAAARRSEKDLEAMRDAHQKMKDSGNDADEFTGADIAFHQAVMASASNAFIAALFDPIKQLVWQARRQTKEYMHIRSHAIVAHERIFKAIRDQDPEAARWAMHDHLVQTEEDLDKHLQGDLVDEQGLSKEQEA